MSPSSRVALTAAVLSLACGGSEHAARPDQPVESGASVASDSSSFTRPLRADIDRIHRATMDRIEAEGMLWSGSGDRGCAENLHERRVRALTRIVLLIDSGREPPDQLAPEAACRAGEALDEQIAVLRETSLRPDGPDGDYCAEEAPSLPPALVELRARIAARCRTR